VAPDPTNVVVASAGDVYVAPEGTALPTTLAALASPWVDLGYVSDDGVTFTTSRDTEDINAWQSAEPVRRLVTAEPKTLEFELLEYGRPEAVVLAFRGGSIDVASGVATFTPPTAGADDIRAVVIEAGDDDATFRFCFSRAELGDDVATQLVRNDAARLPISLSVESGSWKIITDHPAWVAAGAIAAEGASADDLVAAVPDASDADLQLLSKDARVSVRKAAKAEQATRAERAKRAAAV